MTFLRGGIRRNIWGKNPVKLEFEKEAKVDIPNPNPKTVGRFPRVKGYQCAICKGLFVAKDVQCDHRVGEHPLRSIEDIQSFVEGIALVRKTDLQMVCKPCHCDKTYAERHGISMELAKATRLAIDAEKKKTAYVVDLLEKSGYNVASNAKARREQLVDLFMKEGK